MVRKLLAASVVTASVFGMIGASSAGAVTLPTGNGAVSCGTSGTIKVVRSTTNLNVARLVVAGTVSGCFYNGQALPFVGGATRSIVVGTPARVCAMLADGTTTAGRTAVTVKVLGIVLSSAAAKVTVTIAPSGSGSSVDSTGSVTLRNGTTITAAVGLQTDRPLADLCNGATAVLYQGTASLAWSRP